MFNRVIPESSLPHSVVLQVVIRLLHREIWPWNWTEEESHFTVSTALISHLLCCGILLFL